MIGVTTTHHRTGPKGWYSPSLRRISTRRGLSIADYRATLAHELGHAVYGDQHTGHGHFDQKQERRADRFAAGLLVEPDALEAACAFYGQDIAAVANDLDVTPHLINVYLQTHPERTPTP